MVVPRVVALLILPLLLGPLGGLTAAPAVAAEPRASIESVTPRDGGLVVRLRATDLPAGTELDGSSARVLLSGEPVATVEHSLESQATTTAPRRVALVIDTSGSMAGAPLEAARAAAAAYLTSVPSDVEVALITFDEVPRVVVAPTTDRRAISMALPGLVAAGGTSLFDAVAQARETLGSDGERRVLVLSDGEDTASRADLQQAVSAVRDGELDLDAVALGQAAAALTALRRLSEVGNGQVLRAGDDVEAVSAFQQAAQAFSADLELWVDVPGDHSATSATLDVSVATAEGLTVHGTSPVVLPEAPADGTSRSRRPVALIAGLLALFGGLATALVLAVRSGDAQAVGRRRTDEVLAAYTLRAPVAPTPGEASRVGDGALARGALALAGRLLDRGHRAERLTLRLDRAAVRFTAREWLVLQGTSAILAFGLAFLLSGVVLAVPVALAAPAAAHLWLSIKGSRRAARFEDELPDALQLVASGLATGYSLPQALDSVVKEGRPPLGEELGRALAENRLGSPLESALDKVADRMDSNDFRWVVMAIRVQREVGGNLSEVLTTLCQTMRERGALRRQIKALSAEGRMGAMILILMPIFVVAYLSLLNPDFFRPMWETTLGNVLLGGSCVALSLGALWMKKIIKVEA